MQRKKRAGFWMLITSVLTISCASQNYELAKSGCCSWHGGVCGCSGGSVTCCDDSASPTCTCLKDDENEKGDLACLER